ncbi:MAG: alpha/beta hydrolase [Acidobacteria bacterium]|nr:MAG: alpha/beta hydrolase [Acidobacteriota bacterium]REK02990.1 MAG: alpha/beta hydrolase [Acidobacteriota bacterium]REK13206.1 MAG: alpha/beta hydrolase [Acidobacteriota bacterium]REK41200.1 MAG: alpha/beta hydrolase [Acidobacteriota bacterium]
MIKLSIRSALTVLLTLFPFTVSVFTQVSVGDTFTIRSSVLDEDRTYDVFVPDSYAWAKDRSYPVLYVLDGESQFLHTAVSAGFLMRNTEIPEMIVVGIRSTVRVRDYTQSDWPEVWIGGGGAKNFKKFLSSEMIPKIESTYRTDGFRVLSGHSAAGQFVLYCLTEEPALFKAYNALAPSLDWDDNLPQRTLKASFENTAALNSFLYVARSDDFGKPLQDYETLVATLRTKSPNGFRWFERPFPGETHSGMALLAQIDALRSLYAGYHFHNDEVPKGFKNAEEHFSKISEKVGWTLPVPESVINTFGYEALSRDKTDEAIKFFRRNVRENQYSANAWDSLADGLEKKGDLKEAAASARKAATLAREFDLPNREYFERHAKELEDKVKE